MDRFVSVCCQGERCFCGATAEHKVEEYIFSDDPTGTTTLKFGDVERRVNARHPFTAYICHDHFRQIMGPMVDDYRFSVQPESQEHSTP